MKSICTLIALVLGFSNATANVVGSDFQNFNPTTNGLDFVTVHSSETLEPGVLNLGAFINYAQNTLPYFNLDNENEYNDLVGYLDLNFGLGLLKNWEVGVNLPFNVFQEIRTDDDTDVGYFDERGLTEIRLNTKYRLLGNKLSGVGLVGSAVFNQIKNNPYKGDSNDPDYVFEIVGDLTFGIVNFGLNAGYKLRNTGEQTDDDIEPYDDSYIASAAVSFLVPGADTKIIAEVFGSIPVEEYETNTDRAQAASEFIVGMKHDFSNNVSAHLGGGTELDNATGSPDWRVYAGLNWALGPLWGGKSEVKELPKEEIQERYQPIVADVDIPETPDEVYIVANINFKFGSFKRINPGGLAAIDQIMDKVIDTDFDRIMISGHTDSIGSDKYNEGLSRDRALQVKKYIMKKYKVIASKIESEGYGETRPIADNGNYQGRRANRRVEIEIFR